MAVGVALVLGLAGVAQSDQGRDIRQEVGDRMEAVRHQGLGVADGPAGDLDQREEEIRPGPDPGDGRPGHLLLAIHL